MFYHSHILMPLQKNSFSRIPGMEPHHQTYAMLGQGGQVSGGSRWTVGRRPLWQNTVQVNLQLSIHKEWRPCVSWFEPRSCKTLLGWTDLITFWSHFPTLLLTHKPLRTRQWWIHWFLGSIYIYIYIYQWLGVSYCIDPAVGSRAGLQNIGLWPICDIADSLRMLRVSNKTV